MHQNVIIMQDCWIRNAVGVQGVFEESPWFFRQYCIESLWGETWCSEIDQTSAAALKKSDMNKNKKH